jgi:hypothetical protein
MRSTNKFVKETFFLLSLSPFPRINEDHKHTPENEHSYQDYTDTKE